MIKITMKNTRRYYYYDDNNQPVNVTLKHYESVPENYIRGMYIDPQKMEQKKITHSKIMKGVAKSETQKLNMRLAKLNVSKSENHKKNMSKTHILRCQRVKFCMSMICDINHQTMVTLEANFHKKYINNELNDLPEWYIKFCKEQENASS